MVVSDLDLVWAAFSPDEADPEAIIDADRVLALSIALQRLQAVPRRSPKVVQPRGLIQLIELPPADREDIARQGLPGRLRILAIEHILGALIEE